MKRHAWVLLFSSAAACGGACAQDGAANGSGGAGGAGTGGGSGSSTSTASSSSSGAGGSSSSSSGAGGSSSGQGGAGGGGGMAPPTAPNGYYVAGKAIYDGNGAPHAFHGAARPSLEWSTTGDHISAQDFTLMASWKANVVRIALNQDFWLSGAAKHDPGYPATVDQAIGWAHQAALDVILDLHWSDKGDLSNQNPGQQKMADQNSIAFWKEVASKYKDDGRVMFELYNEPHDVSWSTWLSGGDSGDGFTAVGMQALYDAVRGAGAENLVFAGGLDWAFDLSGVPTHRVQGHNIVYVTHPYDFPGKQPADWDAAWGFLTATDPVTATEFGNFDCTAGYYTNLIQYADAHGASWTAWAWFPGGCMFPSIIDDWSGGPSAPGQVVKAALQAY